MIPADKGRPAACRAVHQGRCQPDHAQRHGRRGLLIGAKGLGEDVLEALQYANVGQGILAGFAILFCAMMLDRIVQGRNR